MMTQPFLMQAHHKLLRGKARPQASRYPFFIIAALLVLIMAIGACSPTKDFPCTVSDWSETGYADGIRGYSGQLFHRHAQACMREGLKPDHMGYIVGHDQGITKYCDPYSAQLAGVNGKKYSGNCPQGLERAYLERYQAGQRINHINNLVTQRREQINQLTEDSKYAYTDIDQRLFRKQIRFLIDEIAALEKEKKHLAAGKKAFLNTNDAKTSAINPQKTMQLPKNQNYTNANDVGVLYNPQPDTTSNTQLPTPRP